MGLFSKKSPCPVCGGKISWFLPTKIEDEYICSECSAKIDVEDSSGMTMQELLKYLAFYEENQTLKSSFVISEKLDFGFFNTKLLFDLEHHLFCLSSKLDKTIFEGSALTSFRITEDSTPLLEGSAAGLVRHISTVPERMVAMGPQIQMMAMTKRMADQAERMRNDDNRPSYRPHVNIPEPFGAFHVELYFNHPYWKTFRSDLSGPTFNNDYPDVRNYLDEYQRDVEVMERLAALLMQVAFPGAGEKNANPTCGLSGSATTPSAERTADDILKFKGLLDAGVIIQEEFDVKKKQLLGI